MHKQNNGPNANATGHFTNTAIAIATAANRHDPGSTNRTTGIGNIQGISRINGIGATTVNGV